MSAALEEGENIAAMIARETSARPGKIWCFVAVPEKDRRHPAHPFKIAIAVLGERGYERTRYDDRWDSYDRASDRADALNALLPYDASACLAIVADTMSRSRFHQEEERGIVVVRFERSKWQAIAEELEEMGGDLADLREEIELILED